MKTPLQEQKDKERMEIWKAGGTYKEMGAKCGICEAAFWKWAKNNNLIKKGGRLNKRECKRYSETLALFEIMFFKYIEKGIIKTPDDIGLYFKGWNKNSILEGKLIKEVEYE